jgi:hypothetical protein
VVKPLVATEEDTVCRSIRTLRHRDGRVSDEETRAAALQFVRKVSGYRAPSRANEGAFNLAVETIAAASIRLLESLKRPGAR